MPPRLAISCLLLTLALVATLTQMGHADPAPTAAPSLPAPLPWMRFHIDGNGGAVTSLAFSPKDHVVSFGTASGKLRQWNLSPLATRATLLRTAGWVTYTLLAHAGTDPSIITASPDGTLNQYWGDDLELQNRTTNMGTIAALSRDGRWLVITFGTFEVRVIKMVDLVPDYNEVTIRNPDGVTGTVTSLALNYVGDRVLYGVKATRTPLPLASPTQKTQGLVMEWDRLTGRVLFLETLGDAVTDVAFSFDNRLVAATATGIDGASGSERGYVGLYDARTMQRLPSPPVLEHGATTVAFHPQGHLLATGQSDGTVRLWDVATARLLACFPAHQGPVGALAFNNRGDVLASGGADERVRGWDVAGALKAATSLSL